MHQDLRDLGPVKVAALTTDQALAQVVGAVTRREPLMLAFCNAHTVNMAFERPAFAATMRRALVLNDGIGVELGSRMLYGRGFPENLNGTDFTPRLLAALPAGTRLFLVGSAPDVVERAGSELARRFPTLVLAGTQHGFFTDGEAPALAERIRASGAEMVLVGMGHPRQELWAAEWIDTIGAVLCCVGAFLDFSAGAVTRAPSWMRNWRIEWLYRLLLEPRRMASRYLAGNPRFLWRMIAQRVRG